MKPVPETAADLPPAISRHLSGRSDAGPAIAALRDGAEPVWLFAYGSLMWNPEMRVRRGAAGVAARLSPPLLPLFARLSRHAGAARAWCSGSTAAAPAAASRYRLPPERSAPRSTGSGRARWPGRSTTCGRCAWRRRRAGSRAYAFVVRRDSPDYAGRLSLDEAARIIAVRGRRARHRARLSRQYGAPPRRTRHPRPAAAPHRGAGCRAGGGREDCQLIESADRAGGRGRPRSSSATKVNSAACHLDPRAAAPGATPRPPHPVSIDLRPVRCIFGIAAHHVADLHRLQEADVADRGGYDAAARPRVAGSRRQQSISDMIQPPKMSPAGLVSAGIAQRARGQFSTRLCGTGEVGLTGGLRFAIRPHRIIPCLSADILPRAIWTGIAAMQ